MTVNPMEQIRVFASFCFLLSQKKRDFQSPALRLSGKSAVEKKQKSMTGGRLRNVLHGIDFDEC